MDMFEMRENPEISHEEFGRSINIALSNRSWPAFKRIDLLDKVRELSVKLKKIRIQTADGRTIDYPYGPETNYHLCIRRTWLWKLLLNEAMNFPNVTVYFNSKVVNVHLNQ